MKETQKNEEDKITKKACAGLMLEMFSNFRTFLLIAIVAGVLAAILATIIPVAGAGLAIVAVAVNLWSLKQINDILVHYGTKYDLFNFIPQGLLSPSGAKPPEVKPPKNMV